MRIASGVTDQYIYFVGVDSTDFTTRETGLSSFTVYRSRNGAAAAAMTTPTINETDSSNMPGVYELLLDEDMTIGAGNDTEEMAFHITHAGMAPVTRTIELYRSKITAGNTLGVESDGDLTQVNTVANQVTADVTAISGDSVAANNAESFFDGTGYAGTNNVIPTVTTLTGHTAQTGDNYARLGAPAGASVSADVAAVKAETALIVADTNELQTDDVPGLIAALNDPTAATIADAVWDEALAGHVGAGSYGKAVADIETDATAILADTNELQTDDVPGLIAALNDISTAQVNTEVDTALSDIGLDHLVGAAVIGTDITDDSIIAQLVSASATADWDDFDNTSDSLQAIRDRGDAAWTTGAGTGLTALASGTAQAGTASTIQLAAGETFADDELNGNVVKLTGGTGAGQARLISDYTGATDTANVTPNWTTNPDATSTYEIVEGPVNVVQIEGSDATDQIRDAVVDDATRIDASALNTLSGNDPGSQLAAQSDITALNDPTAATIADAVWDELATGHTDAGKAGQQLWTDVDAILADTNELQSDDVPTLIAALPTAVENRQEMDSNSTQLAAIVADTNELQTDDVPGLIAALNDPTAATIADAVLDEALSGHVAAGSLGKAVADIETDTATQITHSGTAALGDTAVKITLTGGVATDNYYNGQLLIITGGTGAGQARTILKYLAAGTAATPTRDFTVAPDNTSTFVVIGADVAGLLEGGIAQAGGAATITIDATASSTDSIYVNNFIMVTGGTGSGQTRLIGAYDGTTKVTTIVPNWTTNPDNTSIYQILPMARVDIAGWLGNLVTGDGDWAALKAETAAILADTNELQTDDVPGLIAALNDIAASDVTTDMDANSTQLAAIVADTNELQTDWVNGGRLDLIIDAVLADTNELQGDWTNGGRLDLIIDAILADTNELQSDDVPGLIAALNDLSAAEVNTEVDTAFTTQMADSVPADGTIPTREQALYMINQFLLERAVAGTTVTVKKVDGSTSLMTLTLDDGTTPTSITRAT